MLGHNGGDRVRKPLQFAGEAHYIGSFSKEDHVRDYYQIVVDGTVSYIYVKVKREEDGELEGWKGISCMIALTQEDLLRGLKHCLCLAKQDILFSDYLNDNSTYWKTHANARQGIYRWLQSMISEHGVNHAYLLAMQRYEDLPLFSPAVQIWGEKEALEVFFLLVVGESSDNQLNALH